MTRYVIMAKRRRRRSRNSRRRRIRNAIRITLFFLIVVAIISGIILLVSKLINKGGETGDIGSDAAIEQPAGQEEENQGFFARLFKRRIRSRTACSTRRATLSQPSRRSLPRRLCRSSAHIPWQAQARRISALKQR